jgi:hypothetical protein
MFCIARHDGRAESSGVGLFEPGLADGGRDPGGMEVRRVTRWVSMAILSIQGAYAQAAILPSYHPHIPSQWERALVTYKLMVVDE